MYLRDCSDCEADEGHTSAIEYCHELKQQNKADFAMILLTHSFMVGTTAEFFFIHDSMSQAMELWLSCYLVLLSIDYKTRFTEGAFLSSYVSCVTNQPSVSDWVIQVPLWPSGLGIGLWSQRPGVRSQHGPLHWWQR